MGTLALAGVCGLFPGLAGATCHLEDIVGVSFGNYTSSAVVPLDSAGSISFRCDGQLIPVTIDLSQGSSGSYASRTLKGPSNSSLNYNLYTDVTRLLVWGNGLSGTAHYGPILPLLGETVTLPVYGRIPAGQSVAAGSYSDTLVVTITF
ncbi:spore coat U domain-containing protein [Corallococcus sp. EGB]|uniref:Csu type fimbrial protein n=1 Tax=Corallococcus sp. EGB TaxID=1521117 RepID=UPI001CBD6F83|nr:spore coat U domain-containing protein [Corallococcus sp. EGB]